MSFHPDEFAPHVLLVYQKTGFKVTERNQKKLLNYFGSRLREFGFSPASYYELLTSYSADAKTEWENIYQQISTPETYFFRDETQMKLIVDYVIPNLINAARRRCDFTIKILSAGCSTGEEVYSLAILIHYVLKKWSGWHIEVYGIDFNQKSIQAAERGIYEPWSVRINPLNIPLEHYADLRNNQYIVKEFVRSKTRFILANLVDESWTLAIPSNFDLIVCRNVFIYLQLESIKNIMVKFKSIMRCPGAYLITGHAEIPHHFTPPFQQREYNSIFLYET